MIKRYRKKPVVIEAVQWTGDNKVEVQRFVGRYLEANTIRRTVVIPTLEGPLIATDGDYIIKGVHGEFYPCKPDIFEQTYEEAGHA